EEGAGEEGGQEARRRQVQKGRGQVFTPGAGERPELPAHSGGVTARNAPIELIRASILTRGGGPCCLILSGCRAGRAGRSILNAGDCIGCGRWSRPYRCLSKKSNIAFSARCASSPLKPWPAP